MTIYTDKMRGPLAGDPIERRISEPGYVQGSCLWVDRERYLEVETEVIAWAKMARGDIFFHNLAPWTLATSDHPSRPFAVPPFFGVEFTSAEDYALFSARFYSYLVKNNTYETLSTQKLDKCDEPHPSLPPGFWLSFPTGVAPRSYFLPNDIHWFSGSAFDLIVDMGFELERGKVKNLISFANGDINLWYYLSMMPKEWRAALGDEWMNFVLGPMAATLKLKGLGFSGRDEIIHPGGLMMLFEAMHLELVPPGKRKNLYEALITRFNAEAVFHHGYLSEIEARVAFYSILTDILAPIFDEASGDELTAMIVKALADNPKQAEEAKTDPKVVGWLMGQVMRASPTKLDPNTVRAAIIELL
jgi:hypothetical protein